MRNVLIYVCYRYGIQSCFLLEIADETSNFNTLFLVCYNSVNFWFFALKDCSLCTGVQICLLCIFVSLLFRNILPD